MAIHLLGSIKATRLAAGGTHSLALSRDGWTYAWGDNSYKQLGVGATTTPQPKLALVMPPNGFTAKDIAAGGGHSLAIGADGMVYAWGDNSKGQADGGAATTSQPYPALIRLPVKDIAVEDGHAIAAGGGHSLAIGVDEQVYGWGDNTKGQVNSLRASLPQPTPAPVALPAIGPISVAAGESHSLALGSDGQVYAWGDNSLGQLGCGNTNWQHVPVRAKLPAGIRTRAIAAGGRHSLALCSDGKIYAWGVNAIEPEPVDLPPGITAIAIAAGTAHNLAIGSSRLVAGPHRLVYAWGESNSSGELGDGTTTARNAPALVDVPLGITARTIAAGGGHNLATGS